MEEKIKDLELNLRYTCDKLAEQENQIEKCILHIQKRQMPM